MATASFTTSTTGVDLGAGVVNGLYVSGSTAGGRIRLTNAASTTAASPLVTIQPNAAGTGYVSLGGMLFSSNCLVSANAAYGGLTLIRQ